jgi:HSP20 family protein
MEKILEKMRAKDVKKMRDRIQHLMQEFFKDVKPLGYRPDQSFGPPMDIYETQDHLVVVLEIAGVRVEDIQVVLERDILSISGKRLEGFSVPKTHLHQMEIDYGFFERSLKIPFPLGEEEIKATYRDGFLFVTIPKLKESVSMTVEVSFR